MSVSVCLFFCKWLLAGVARFAHDWESNLGFNPAAGMSFGILIDGSLFAAEFINPRPGNFSSPL